MDVAGGLRSKFAWRFFSVIAILVVCAGPASVKASLLLDGAAQSFALDGHLAMLEDEGGTLGIADAIRHDFHPLPRRGLAPGVVWYRFTVSRPAGMPADWVLAFGEPDIDDVRVYVPAEGGGFTETRLGRRIPSAELPLAARRHVAMLDLPEADPVTIHIRLASQHKIRFEDAALWRPNALMFEEARESTLYGIQIGTLAVIIVVYALFGLWLRDGPMLIYCLLVGTRLCGGLTHMSIVTLLFPDAGRNANYILSGIGLIGGVAAFIFLWDRILDLKKTFPAVHRIYMVAGTAVAASLLLVMSPAFTFAVPPAQAIMLAASIGNIVLASILLRRNPQDVLLKFYLFAFLPVVAAWVVEVAAIFLPSVPADLGRRMDLTSTMGHIAILCVAMAYRLGQMQRQRIGAEIALAGERLARQRQRTFIDMATHEFKTPLAVIDSAAQMLGMFTAPARPEVEDRIAVIRRAVQRLIKLIDTCLAGERNEMVAVRVHPVEPAAIVRQAAERNHEPERRIVVTTDRLPDTCLADSALLGIVLDALIDNARRYGPVGQPVEISATGQDGRITFAVHDRGPGVPSDETTFIFDKYYRCAASSAIPGTGIGLHLVKTIADLHGGTASYRPREGGGASFAVTIPA